MQVWVLVIIGPPDVQVSQHLTFAPCTPNRLDLKVFLSPD